MSDGGRNGAECKSVSVRFKVQGGGRRLNSLSGARVTRFEAILKACALRRSRNGEAATSFMTIAAYDIVDAGGAGWRAGFMFAARTGTAMPCPTKSRRT
jgi:hypothetical protein